MNLIGSRAVGYFYQIACKKPICVDNAALFLDASVLKTTRSFNLATGSFTMIIFLYLEILSCQNSVLEALLQAKHCIAISSSRFFFHLKA